MKKHVFYLVLMLLTTATSTVFAHTTNDARPAVRLIKQPIGVFINGHAFNVAKDSLEITAKGMLSLFSLDAKSQFKFKVVIRHRAKCASISLTMIDERFEDGKVFEKVSIEEVLKKAQVGDEILIIPVDVPVQFESWNTPLSLTVSSDRC